MKIPNAVEDKYADQARELWQALRETDFHDGRNRVAAALREAAAQAREEGRKEIIEKVWRCLVLAGKSIKTFKILFTTPDAASLRSEKK